MDVYDEVDRRETDSSKSLPSLPFHTVTTCTIPLPLLLSPPSPLLSLSSPSFFSPLSLANDTAAV